MVSMFYFASPLAWLVGLRHCLRAFAVLSYAFFFFLLLSLFLLPRLARGTEGMRGPDIS